jgi:hypothetical protein
LHKTSQSFSQVRRFSVELLASLVTHYLVGHDLVRRFDAAIIPAAADPARPLVTLPARAVRDRDYRAELRARRRARRGAAVSLNGH